VNAFNNSSSISPDWINAANRFEFASKSSLISPSAGALYFNIIIQKWNQLYALVKGAVAKTAVEKHMHGRKQTTSDERSLIAIAAATLGLTLGLSLFPPLKWSKLARNTADWKPPRVRHVETPNPQCYKPASIISRAKIRMSQVLMAMMMTMMMMMMMIYDDGDEMMMMMMMMVMMMIMMMMMMMMLFRSLSLFLPLSPFFLYQQAFPTASTAKDRAITDRLH
jgi:hypothetical protein